MIQLIIGILLLGLGATSMWFGGHLASEGWKSLSSPTPQATIEEPQDNNAKDKLKVPTVDDEIPTRNFELLDSALEPINSLKVSLHVRGNHAKEYTDYGEFNGPPSRLSIILKDKDTPIELISLQEYRLVRMGSGQSGRVLQIDFELAENSFVLGQPVSILGEANQLILDISNLLKTLDLGVTSEGECEVDVNVSVNNIYSTSTRAIFSPFNILTNGSGAINDDTVLPNIPYVYTLQTEKEIKGPIFSSYLISKMSEYTAIIKYLNSITTDDSKVDLTPNSISFLTFDHRSGNRMNMSKTTYKTVTNMMKDFAATNTLPLSVVIAGATVIEIEGEVKFTVPLNSPK
jgi:hypothetical protein